MCEVGCGLSSPIQWLELKRVVGVDRYAPALAEARRRGAYDELQLCDVRDIGRRLAPKQFNACVALDVIEHLTKEEGRQLLCDMERLASKKVIVFTPNGFLPQTGTGEDFQTHLSGWETGEMQSLGYKVEGVLGWKVLRGEQHGLRFRPRTLWSIVSYLTQLSYTRSHPHKAAALLCVKTLSERG